MSLTDTQAILLSAASQRDDHLVPTDDRLKGGAIGKVANGLLSKGFVTEIAVTRDQPFWRVDDAGACWGLRIAAAGLKEIGIDDEVWTDAVQNARAEKADAPSANDAQEKMFMANVRIRAGSKQAQLIAMLSRDSGATITEMSTALGWLSHTTRAALTGLRHKGYKLAREISGDRSSLYRITAMPIMAPAATNAAQAEAA